MHIKPKILFIGDALSSLKLASDTSIAFCEAALNLDLEVFWCEKKEISFFNYEIVVNKAAVITQASTQSLKYEEIEISIKFSEFTYCFIRCDPPFDESYQDLCWILNTQTKVRIFNSPSALLNFHEKSFHIRALSEGVLEEKNLIPTCMTESLEIAKKFLNEQSKNGVQNFITKPWLGHGGADVQLWENQNDLFDYLTNAKSKLLIQPYLAEIHTVGDRRVLIANGKIVSSYVRIPPEGSIASNLVRGGSALLRDMTSAQEALCKKLGEFIFKHSVSFAGIDLIGEKVGEINITSPTGLRTVEQMTGQSITKKILADILYSKK